MNIREFRPTDYDDIVEINNSIYPDCPTSTAERRQKDTIGFGSANLHRWVAESKGIVIAHCHFQNMLWDYHPKRFEFNILVRPECQKKGVGSRLYDFLLAQMTIYEPISVSCWFRDQKSNIRFLKKRGYIKKQRESASRLDIEQWAEDGYSGLEGNLKMRGIRILTLLEFQSLPNWKGRIYELDKKVTLDIPGNTSVPDFDVWKKAEFGSVFLMPECYFLALHGDEVVGVSNVFSKPTEGQYDIGLTAVKRGYRGMGIAMALKVKCIMYLKSIGAKTLETGNEENNEAILHLNKKLGFKSVPDWLLYETPIK